MSSRTNYIFVLEIFEYLGFFLLFKIVLIVLFNYVYLFQPIFNNCDEVIIFINLFGIIKNVYWTPRVSHSIVHLAW